MSKTVVARPNRYTREQITEALQLAAYYRSSKKASDITGIPDSTILSWRTKHPEIHEACLTRLDETLAERSEKLVRDATEAELLFLEKIVERVDELEARDLANTLRNISTTKGITFERVVGPIRGRPNVVIEHREPTKLLEQMAQIAAMVRPEAPVVDGSAEPADAELVGQTAG